MDQRMINIGFGNSVVASRILVVVNPKSSPIKKLKDESVYRLSAVQGFSRRDNSRNHNKKMLMTNAL